MSSEQPPSIETGGSPASADAVCAGSSEAVGRDHFSRIRTESHSFHTSFSATGQKAQCSMIDYGVASEQGTRKTMEDQHKALLCDDPVTPREGTPIHSAGIPFFGVYDGHGGTQCAEFLRSQLHRVLLAHPLVRSHPQQAVKEAILQCEEAFMKKCVEERIESGSTIALAFIVEDHLITANVGDSEIVLCHNGEPKVLTTRHHLSNETEVERVKACGGRIFHTRVGHPKFNPQLVSLAVSRAIGDAGFKLEEYTDGKLSGVIPDPDTQSLQLTPEDEFLIIGCDGLWDVIKYQEAVDFCRALFSEGASCQHVSQSLVQEALHKGSTDNVTVLLVNLRQRQTPSQTESSP